MKDEEIIEAVYNAALDHINSVVPPKMVHDLDIVVGMDDGEITVEVRLITGRSEEIDQKTVEEAVKVASEKADELMKGQKT